MGEVHWGREYKVTGGTRAGTPSVGLRCTCKNSRFHIHKERVARQVKSMHARHIRLVAICTKCRAEKTIGWPN